MDELVLSSSAQRHIAGIIAQPPHALLITGPAGSGKRTLAIALTEQLLGNIHIGSYAYARIFEPDNQTISVEQAREVTSFMRLKTTGEASLRRGVVIVGADTMTREAQNALLKTLEEPPLDTILIMTADDPMALLPTVRSRVQQIAIEAPDEETLKAYFTKQGYTDTQVMQAYSLSDGLPGLMHALLSSEASHPLVESVSEAKKLLSMTTFERLAMIEPILKQKQQLAIVQAISRIASAALHQSAKRTDNDTAIKRWASVLELSLAAEQQLRQSVQAKLVMTNLFLNL